MNYEKRISKVREAMSKLPVDAIFVTNLMNVRYLCGFTGSNGMLLVTEKGSRFFTDGRYRTQSADQVEGADVVIYQDPPELGSHLKTAASEMRATQVGFEATNVTFARADELRGFFEGAVLHATNGVVEELRAVKEPEELDLMRTAAHMADDGFSHILDFVRTGMTEQEVALELEFYLRKNGAEDVSFSPIVAAAERSALPHAHPTDRLVEEGRFLLFDLGCKYKGYCSDLTRTVVIGEPDSRHSSVYEVILAANEAGLRAAGPDKPARDVDRAARDVVEAAGYPEAFSHGLGHGVGLEVHEGPTVRSTSDDVLKPGNVITIEPGAYFPDWGGVRVEDLCVITESGIEVLSKSPKELIAL